MSAADEAYAAELAEARAVVALDVTVRCTRSCRGLVARLVGDVVQFHWRPKEQRRSDTPTEVPVHPREPLPTTLIAPMCRACGTAHPYDVVRAQALAARRRGSRTAWAEK